MRRRCARRCSPIGWWRASGLSGLDTRSARVGGEAHGISEAQRGSKLQLTSRIAFCSSGSTLEEDPDAAPVVLAGKDARLEEREVPGDHAVARAAERRGQLGWHELVELRGAGAVRVRRRE